jgi:hypothetical protein
LQLDRLISALTEQENLLNDLSVAKDRENLETSPERSEPTSAQFLSRRSPMKSSLSRYGFEKEDMEVTGLNAAVDDNGYQLLLESNSSNYDFQVFLERMAKSRDVIIKDSRLAKMASTRPRPTFHELIQWIDQLSNTE